MIEKKLLRQVEIIFEDEYLVVVSKPSGLLSIQDRYQQYTPHLKAFLQEKFNSIYTVHRLDRDTSGIMVFAKDARTHKFLSKQFANREVQKIYWAFVKGKPMFEEGIIDIPIINDMKNSGMMIPHSQGKPAETKFRLLENYGNISLLEFFPLTGRTHQIRVHSKHLGCPLLIDEIYSQESAFYLSSIKRKYHVSKFENEKPLLSRLTLHAKKLEFTHPSGNLTKFESDLPKDLKALRKQLQKNG